MLFSGATQQGRGEKTVQLTLDRLTALRALRVFRGTRQPLPSSRCDLPAPDPSPQRRWTTRILPLERIALRSAPSAERPIEVVAPSAQARLQASFARCRVRSTSVPPRSFVDLGDGLFIPCPELLFFELADVLTMEALALLAYELCGTYTRDAAEPRLGEVAYDVPPVTSVDRIRAYLDELGDRTNVTLARHALSYAADNAWSPMESIVALMTCLRPDELGYGLGRVRLNVRHGATPELVALGCKGSRVPDIEVEGTHVGFNYDSTLHLDLGSIAEAASGGDATGAIRSVREKYLDDLRRNRELAALGSITLPVTAQDLFAPGGLDAVMLEAAMVIDQVDGGFALSDVRAILGPGSLQKRRQQLIWSLLPWEEGAAHARAALARRPWDVAL